MRKKLLTVVVGSALVAATGAAFAAPKVEVSGWVARGIMYVDDGISGETYHVDATTIPSRFRLVGSDDIFPGIKAGANFEMGMNSNPSGGGTAVSQTAKSVAATISERWSEVWFQGAMGKIFMGQGDGAAKDVVNFDLSGTNFPTSGNPGDVGGTMSFRRPQSAGAAAGPILNNVTNNFDGGASGGRYDRLRYDSPALGPVVLGVSSGTNNNDDIVEGSVKVNANMGGAGRLAGGVAYSRVVLASNAFHQKTWGGSVAYLAPMGFNVRVAYAKRTDDNSVSNNTTGLAGSNEQDGRFMMVKLGYTSGMHSVSGHWAKGKNQGTAGTAATTATDARVTDVAKQIGIEYDFKPQPWADIWIAAKKATLDRPGTDYEDIKALWVGSRIVF